MKNIEYVSTTTKTFQSTNKPNCNFILITNQKKRKDLKNKKENNKFKIFMELRLVEIIENNLKFQF